VVGLAQGHLDMSFSLFLPDFAWWAILLTAVALPIVCLLLYRFSRRRVWLWLGWLSGMLLLLEVAFVVLFVRAPLWFIELLAALFQTSD